MTDEEINIAIAEHCGWTRIQKWDDYWLGTPPQSNDHIIIPDYCNNINSIIEAKNELNTPTQRGQYVHELLKIVGGVPPYSLYVSVLDCWMITEATPRQCAEAILKVIEGNRE